MRRQSSCRVSIECKKIPLLDGDGQRRTVVIPRDNLEPMTEEEAIQGKKEPIIVNGFIREEEEGPL